VVVEEVHRGMRAAINLAGIRHEDVIRGQEVATPGYLEPARVLTIRLHCLADMKRPIKHRAPVRFHLGMTYAKLGRPQDAVSALRRAAQLDPKLAERENIAQAIKDLGG